MGVCPENHDHSAGRLYVILALLLVVVSALLRWLLSVLSRLDTDCKDSTAALFFEDPTRLQKLPLPSLLTAASKTLTVVFPAYNEELRLPAALDEALAFLQEKRKRLGVAFTYEVIIVDDGSKDGTYEVAMGYVKRYGLDTVRALRLPVNKGKGFAVRAGMLAARGQLLLFADSDGATQFSDVDRLEERMAKIASAGPGAAGAPGAASIADKHGMVVGSRANLESTEAVAKRHWFRNVLMHGFHFLVLCVAGSSVRDTQCGFKMVTRRTGRVLFSNMRLQRWCFDVELVYLAVRLGIPIAEECVNWTEIAGSKLKFYSIISMAAEMLLIKLAYSSGTWHVTSEAALPSAS